MRGRGEGIAVANFVTFKDKLGHDPSCATVFLYIDALLPCKIKTLGWTTTKEMLAFKMQLMSKVQMIAD